MATVVDIARLGNARHLVSESTNLYRSREQGTVVSGSGKCPAGMVMGIVTATGKYAPYDAANSPAGVGTAKGVLFEDIDATSADVKVTLNVRDTEFKRAMLAFKGTPTQPQKDAAYASLASAGCAFR